jgi:two-component system, OmpR family, response regulator
VKKSGGPSGTGFALRKDGDGMTAGPGKGRHALRVLVVDDNRDSADTLAHILELWGYTTKVAYDGASALAAARDCVPDCYITDISMPGMDGYSLVKQVRQLSGLERTTFVSLSSHSDTDHDRRAREAGFNHTLVKPADFDQLRGILTMLEQVLHLATQTEQMSRKNVALAGETKALMEEVKKDIQEVKNDVREMKEEIRGALDRPTEEVDS